MATFAEMQERRMQEQQAERDAAQAQRTAAIARDLAARTAELKVTGDRIARGEAALTKEREQGARDLERQAADAREREMRARFDKRFPGGSDSDFRTMRPMLLAEIGAETEAQLAGMRGRYRSAV